MVPPLFPGVLDRAHSTTAAVARRDGLGFGIGASPPVATVRWTEVVVPRGSRPELTGPFLGRAAAGVSLLPAPWRLA